MLDFEGKAESVKMAEKWEAVVINAASVVVHYVVDAKTFFRFRQCCKSLKSVADGAELCWKRFVEIYFSSCMQENLRQIFAAAGYENPNWKSVFQKGAELWNNFHESNYSIKSNMTSHLATPFFQESSEALSIRYSVVSVSNQIKRRLRRDGY